METQGIGGNRAVNECIDAAWYYFMDKARSILPGTTLSDHDYLLYYADPQSKGLSTEVSVAELVGLCSAVANRPVMEATAVIGEIKLSGTMGEIKIWRTSSAWRRTRARSSYCSRFKACRS